MREQLSQELLVLASELMDLVFKMFELDLGNEDDQKIFELLYERSRTVQEEAKQKLELYSRA